MCALAKKHVSQTRNALKGVVSMRICIHNYKTLAMRRRGYSAHDADSNSAMTISLRVYTYTCAARSLARYLWVHIESSPSTYVCASVCACVPPYSRTVTSHHHRRMCVCASLLTGCNESAIVSNSSRLSEANTATPRKNPS